MPKSLSFVLALAASILTAVAFFIGIPALVYESNPREFGWEFVILIATYWPWFVGTVVLFTLPALLLPARFARLWAGVCTVVAVYVWAHGIFQTHVFGNIDGREWSASVPLWQSLAEGAVILIGVWAVWKFSLKATKLAIGLMLFLAAGLVLQAASLIDPSKWVAVSSEPRMPDVAQFSARSNGLVVLLDSMTSDLFEEVVKNDPDIRDALRGFTFFSDTVGAAPTTYLSMPTIHSGRIYETGNAVAPFFDEAVRDHSVLSKVADAGYRAMLINAIRGTCPKGVECIRTKVALVGNGASVRSASMQLLDTVLFRIAPLWLKNTVYNQDEWVLNNWTQDKRLINRAVASNALLQEMAASLTASLETPTLKFLHLMNTHPPYVYREGCEYAGELRATRENALMQVRCGLRNLSLLLQVLKDQGIYDCTAIILLADHGLSGVPSTRASAAEWAPITASANPTFAIKPIGANGPFRTGKGEVHLGDFGATLCDLLGVCKADTGVSARREPSGRVRIFQNYSWRHEFWLADTMNVTRYEISGAIGDSENWSRRSFPLQIGKTIDFTSSGDARLYQKRGWAAQGEGVGTWTNGSRASLIMLLSGNSSSPLRLAFEAFGFVAGGPTRVDVLVDGQVIGALDFDETRNQKLANFIIPARATGESLEIDFVISDPRSPSELGLSHDSRKLGMNVRWLRLEAVPEHERTDYPKGRIAFSAKGEAWKYTVDDGWSAPENWGRWATGKTASIVLPVKKDNKADQRMVVKAQAFVPENGVVNAAVLVNGIEVGRMRFDPASSTREQAFIVPLDAIERGNGAMKIDFVVDQNRSPKELGLSEDPRTLGLGLHWLQLEEIKNPT